MTALRSAQTPRPAGAPPDALPNAVSPPTPSEPSSLVDSEGSQEAVSVAPPSLERGPTLLSGKGQKAAASKKKRGAAALSSWVPEGIMDTPNITWLRRPAHPPSLPSSCTGPRGPAVVQLSEAALDPCRPPTRRPSPGCRLRDQRPPRRCTSCSQGATSTPSGRGAGPLLPLSSEFGLLNLPLMDPPVNFLSSRCTFLAAPPSVTDTDRSSTDGKAVSHGWPTLECRLKSTSLEYFAIKLSSQPIPPRLLNGIVA